MRQFLGRFLTAKGDPTLQVIDLLLFLGYFAVCLYAGGIAYESAYNEAFQLQIKSNVTDPSVAVAFVTNVLLSRWYWMPSIVFVLVFIFIFYASRYVWRPWFGYVLLSLLFYATFLGCGMLGQSAGAANAEKDKLAETTSKPAIKLYGNLQDADFETASYHFLSEDDKWFFVFEPQGVAGSLIEVHAIPKSQVDRYQVTIK